MSVLARLTRRVHRGMKAVRYVRWTSLDRALGIEIARSARVDRGATLDAGSGGRILVADRTHVHAGVILATMGRDIVIGPDSSVNPYTIIYGGTAIGAGVRIAAHVVIVPMNHVFSDRTQPIMNQGVTRKGVTIEDDVWVGAGVKVLDGVTIREGCVIAAGAVVTRSTEPSGVYVGVPARRVAER